MILMTVLSSPLLLSHRNFCLTDRPWPWHSVIVMVSWGWASPSLVPAPDRYRMCNQGLLSYTKGCLLNRGEGGGNGKVVSFFFFQKHHFRAGESPEMLVKHSFRAGESPNPENEFKEGLLWILLTSWNAETTYFSLQKHDVFVVETVGK